MGPLMCHSDIKYIISKHVEQLAFIFIVGCFYFFDIWASSQVILVIVYLRCRKILIFLSNMHKELFKWPLLQAKYVNELVAHDTLELVSLRHNVQ